MPAHAPHHKRNQSSPDPNDSPAAPPPSSVEWRGRFLVSQGSSPSGSEPSTSLPRSRRQGSRADRVKNDPGALPVARMLFPPSPAPTQSPQASPFPAPAQPPPTPQFPAFSPSPAPAFQSPAQTQQQQGFLPMNYQPQQQQQQQRFFLFKKDGAPASYSTKWDELHQDSQKFLLLIEDRIREYRDESQRLDQCSRLFDTSISTNSFELDAKSILQDLGTVNAIIERERPPAEELMREANKVLRNLEMAVRTFIMLRPRFIHKNIVSSSQSAVATPSGQTGLSMANIVPPAYEFYSGIPKRPSPYLEQTVETFEKHLAECTHWIQELEQLLHDKNNSSIPTPISESIPNVLSNMYDIFIEIAGKVEGLHQYTESMKMTYLANQRRLGYANDPFLEADRREMAKQEAAAKRIHPTMHLPAIPPQPSTQVAGLVASSSMHSTGAPQQAAWTAGQNTIPSTPSPSPFAVASSPFLLSTPAASVPATSLFATLGSTPQLHTTGATSTSIFGSNAAFASTPASGSAPFFSPQTFGTANATGSGASFGAGTQRARPRSRGTRR